MALTRWILALCGYARLEVCGVHPERVLNACAAAGIACTASEPVDAYTLRITVRARCAETAAELARRCQCEVKTLYRRGLPQLLRRAARYRGACAGLLVAVLAVLTSSLFIWRIDVTGNETLTTGQILRCLDECGVRPGTYWPALSNDLVRNDMILCLPELRWLTVNVHGSRAEVIVREKEPLPDITPDDTPVSIYASATGVILSMDVYAGEARVVPGAAVEPGDVLVSGAVTDLGGGVRPVCARADIRARTRQVLTGQIALTETEKQPAHGAHTRWALRAGKKRINFYQNSGISDAECDKIIHEYPFAIRGVFTLPFSLVRERVQPYRTADAQVPEDTARGRAGRCAWGKSGSIFIKTVEFLTRNVIKSFMNILLRSGACSRCRFRWCVSACSRIGRRTRRYRRTRRAHRSSRRCCSSCARRSARMARSFPMRRQRRLPATC